MTDIMFGERHKTLIRTAIYLLRKKLGKSAGVEAIHNDIMTCPNKVIRILTEAINSEAEQLTAKYQRNTVRELSELALWICYKDTAYRDVFFSILLKAMENPELLDEVRKCAKPSNEWYPNAWIRAKEKTKQLREEGKIPSYAMSPEEDLYVPSKQAKKLKKYGEVK